MNLKNLIITEKIEMHSDGYSIKTVKSIHPYVYWCGLAILGIIVIAI